MPVIGVFDSGVGGLSVWREMVSLMPGEPMLYLADQAHVPYGSRALADVRELTLRGVGWLIERGCTMIVIACNTASAAALHPARALFTATPFVGMEPAVKPAASNTHTNVIGVLATQATFQGALFASVVTRFAANVRVIEQPCPGWVELVESQPLPIADHPLVDRYVLPLLDAGADNLVLGCTHFPFLAPAIHRTIARWQAERGAAREVELIDPSLAVARQAMRVRDQHGLAQNQDGDGACRFWTTGDAAAFETTARKLLLEQPGLCANHISYDKIISAVTLP